MTSSAAPRCRDQALGQEGNDVLDGAEGIDGLEGGTYSSVLTPAVGSDKLFGGPGSDDLVDSDSTSTHGADLLDGGACSAADHPSCPASPPAEAPGDNDTIWYQVRTGNVTVNLTNPAASQGESGEGDTVRHVESVTTGAGNDKVTGNAAFNRILMDRHPQSGFGNDTVDASGDFGNRDEVGCDQGTDTATLDADDVAFTCENVTRLSAPSPGGPGGDLGGGGGSPLSPSAPVPVPRSPIPPTSSPTGSGSPVAATAGQLLASVTQELAQAGRALAQCGTTGLLAKSGCRDSFSAIAPGTVAYRVTATAAGAGTAAAAVIASGRRSIPAAGIYAIKVKATQKGPQAAAEGSQAACQADGHVQQLGGQCDQAVEENPARAKEQVAARLDARGKARALRGCRSESRTLPRGL